MTEIENLLQLIISLQKENLALKEELKKLMESRSSPTSLSSIKSLSSLRGTEEEPKTNIEKTLSKTTDMVLKYAKEVGFI